MRHRDRVSRLFLAGMVCACVGFALTALPAMAQAQPTLKDPNGVLPVGGTVLGTSSNLVFTTAAGNWTCKRVTLDGTVTSNTPAALAGGGEAEGCLAAGALPIEYKVIEFEDEFFAGGTDEGFVFFEYQIPLAGLTGCFLEGPIATTWADGSDIIAVQPSALVGGGGSAGCPTAASISGELTLETEDGTPVTVNE